MNDQGPTSKQLDQMTTAVDSPTTKQRLQALSFAVATVLVASLVAMIGLLVYLAVIDHQRIQQNERIQDFIREQATRNGQYGEQLNDCLTPGGDCYRDQKEQSENTIMRINEYSVGASFCAATLDPPAMDTEYDRFLQCVERYVEDGNTIPDRNGAQ